MEDFFPHQPLETHEPLQYKYTCPRTGETITGTVNPGEKHTNKDLNAFDKMELDISAVPMIGILCPQTGFLIIKQNKNKKIKVRKICPCGKFARAAKMFELLAADVKIQVAPGSIDEF